MRNCFNLSCSVVAGLSIRYKSSCLEVKKISLPGNRFAYDVIYGRFGLINMCVQNELYCISSTCSYTTCFKQMEW